MITFRNGEWGELYPEVIEEQDDNRIVHPAIFRPFNIKDALKVSDKFDSLTALRILTNTPPCN